MLLLILFVFNIVVYVTDTTYSSNLIWSGLLIGHSRSCGLGLESDLLILILRKLNLIHLIVQIRDCLQISLLILSEFKWITIGAIEIN